MEKREELELKNSRVRIATPNCEKEVGLSGYQVVDDRVGTEDLE
jgi:hypothetical protein